MTDIIESDVLYGQLGKPLFDATSSRWCWPRRSIVRQVKWVNGSKDATNPPNTAFSGDHIAPNYLVPGGIIRRLVRAHPMLGAIAHDLRSFLKAEAEPSTSTLHENDPISTGQLLALGNTIRESFDGSKVQSIPFPMMAFPDSVQPNLLCLMNPTNSPHVLQTDVEQPLGYLDIPNIVDTHITRWNTEGDKILQICFAESVNDDSPLLAIRTQNSIAILRPFYRSVPSYDSRASYRADSERVGIHPNHILSLSTDDISGACCDMDFNLKNQLQLATIHTTGEWRVWDLEDSPRSAKQNYRPRILISGKTPGELDQTNSQNDGMDNIMHKIVWIGIGNIITIMNKQKIYAFNTENPRLILGASDLGVRHQFAVPDLLDIKRDPSDKYRLLLLTSTRIFLIAFVVNPEAPSPISASTVLSWRHYRASEEQSLMMSCSLQPTGMMTMLYSQRNSLITMYELRSVTQEDHSSPVIMDPVLLQWSPSTSYSNSDDFKQGRMFSDLFAFSVPFERRDNSNLTIEEDHTMQEPGKFQFYSLVMFTHDYKIITSVFHCTDSVRQILSKDFYVKSSNQKDANAKNIIASDPDQSDDFVEDDLSRSEPSRDTNKVIIEPNYIRYELAPTPILPWEPLYAKFCPSGDVKNENMVQILQNLAKNLDQMENSPSTPLKIMSDLIPSFDLEDIQGASEAIRRLTTRVTFTNDVQVFRLGRTPSLWRLREPLDLSRLATLYAYISDHWMAQEVKHRPTINRHYLEQLARQTAGEVCLSSLGVGSITTQLEDADEYDEQQASSHTAKTRLEMDTIGRLRRYARIDGEEVSLTAPLKRVMAHWTLKADPSEYDYEQTIASLRRPPPVSAKRERMLQKLGTPLGKKQRVEQTASSQPSLHVAWQSSQPVDGGFSQEDQTGSQAPVITASQPERGRNAGRIDAKKTKKRRAGF